MLDRRFDKYAEVLIRHSLKLKKNQKLHIEGSEAAIPFMKKIYKQALLAGGLPWISLYSPTFQEAMLKYGSDEQISYIPKHISVMFEEADAFLFVCGNNNTRQLSSVDTDKISLQWVAEKPLIDSLESRSYEGKIQWCLCQFPTEAAAQEAGMSLDEYFEMVMEASMLNYEDPISEWGKLYERNEKIIDIFSGKKNINIKSVGTDLSFSIENRKWINDSGFQNFPGGEIFTCPVENSVNGYVSIDYPVKFSGNIIDGIFLSFRNGKIIEAEADIGLEYLDALLTMDDGAKKIGEFAIGTNTGVNTFLNNSHFDEKMYGTVHIALGNAYRETGGMNSSTIHTDMIVKMGESGEITADGEVIYKKGRFPAITELN